MATILSPEGKFVNVPTDEVKKVLKKKKESRSKIPPELLEECRKRVSYCKNVYPISTPSQWTEFVGMGWVHSTEKEVFLCYHMVCPITKKWFRTDARLKTINDGYMSPEGKDRGGWFLCAHSGFWDKEINKVEAYDGSTNNKIFIARLYLENHDYFKCDYSGEFYNASQCIRIAGSDDYRLISKQSFVNSGRFKRCDDCGKYFVSEMVERVEFEGDKHWLCIGCKNKRMARASIHPHNYNRYPNAIYAPIKNWRMVGEGAKRRAKELEDMGIRLFGVECEVEMSKNICSRNSLDRFKMATEVMAALGNDFVIIKEDGTLCENGKYSDPGAVYAGFEIVTAPADLSVHKEKWAKLESMPNFKALRAWDTDTCGMHVHVSKDALTTLQIGRILMFMTHDKNKKFIAKVAGRSENKYCRSYAKDKISDGIHFGESDVRDGVEYVNATYHMPRSDETRRQAVNITNDRTIEFRIFRGTVHPRHIIRNLEFVDAVCSYCHPGSRSFKDLNNYQQFVLYCLNNRKEYPLLVEWYESDEIKILPPRNDYGEKDTRGNVKPKVVEALPQGEAPVKKEKKLAFGELVDNQIPVPHGYPPWGNVAVQVNPGFGALIDPAPAPIALQVQEEDEDEVLLANLDEDEEDEERL